jgi:hypothetical protein
MKKIKNLVKYTSLIVLFVVACTDNLRDISFLDSVPYPSNISATYSITQDNTGLVTITPKADGAVAFKVTFGDGSDTVEVPHGESVDHVYAEGTYTVGISASNVRGLEAGTTQTLVVSFIAPQNLVVAIENDPGISKQVNITANADFAATFDFDSGETGVTQPVVSANIGETVSYQYTDPGTYNVKVTAKGGAIATTEYAVAFEVTEILAPIASAPAVPTRSAGDVIAIYTDGAYTDATGTDFFPDWGQASQGSSWAEFDLNGDKMLQYVNLSYQGIQFGSQIDVSGMEFLHLDVWTAKVTQLETSLINIPAGGGAASEKPVTKDLTADAWTSLDIPIADYVSQGLTVDEILQLKFVGTPWAAGTVFIDNIYFYKPSAASTFDDGLLTNGDFQAGSDGWIVGVDDNAPAPVVTASGNTYYSVNVPNAGNPWEVNVSQKVEIIDGKTYTLTFDAWSNVSRDLLAGIGLSGDPWSNDAKAVTIGTTRQTYSVTVSAAGWGAPNARVLFDLGAAAGDVNIDNVSLFEGNGNMVVNGNFENGAAPWIVGVDDNAPANVVNTNGNNHYYVNVAAAGNAWEVNMSQKLEIVDGESYILTFDAWSDRSRDILAGIGLSGDPWSNDAKAVTIGTNRITYSVTVSAAGWGAPNARVLFDMGAAAGEVYIDNVSLSKL